MKKVLILVILLLSVSLVFAENLDESEKSIMDLANFKEEPVQAVRVEQEDMLNFEMYEQKHSLWIREIVNENLKITFFPNKIEGQGAKGVGSFPITRERALYIDVNKDGDDDLKLSIHDIDENKAIIVFNYLHEIETAVPTGAVGVVEEVEKEESGKNDYLVLLALVVLGLIGFVYSKKHSKKNVVDVKAEEVKEEEKLTEEDNLDEDKTTEEEKPTEEDNLDEDKTEESFETKDNNF